MRLINFKNFVYTILIVFVLTLLLPFYTYAVSEDDIYVWSDNSSTQTSTAPDTESNNKTNSR